MQNTVNLNLKKPDQNDFVNIGDINDNMDTLDAEVAKKYVKPLAGIPSLDLDSATQAALKKAETALQSVTKASVGLGNVDNTSDVNKPVSTAQQAALDKKANLASPSLTGTPTAPTAAESTNTQQIATTAFVDRAVKTHQADLAHVHWIGTASGTNTLIATYAPITSYKDGLAVSFKNTTASTRSTTLNINNLGDIPIINSDGSVLSDLKANGVYTVRYSSGNFILQGSQGISRSAQISNLTAIVGSSTMGQIQLNWTNPTDTKFKGVRIVYKTGSYPTSATDGTVFYDSNDATTASTFTKNGFTEGAQYYIRAFAYTYNNADKIFTSTTDGAEVVTIPYRNQAIQSFTSSTSWTVPFNVSLVDVFLVGGGGGGGGSANTIYGGGGGGGGYTTTKKSIAVTPNTSIPITVGNGGNGGIGANFGQTGGTSQFLNSSYQALGGIGGKDAGSVGSGGNGGSGGGSGGSTSISASGGGSNGSNGLSGGVATVGTGQGTTTKSFGDSTGTLYSGGGGGGSTNSPSGSAHTAGYGGSIGGGNGGAMSNNGANGAANTGGGGGGAGILNGATLNGGNGGSGVVIVRWGY